MLESYWKKIRGNEITNKTVMIPVKWRKLLKKLLRDWEIEFELPIYHINNCLQQQGLINEEEVDKAIFIISWKCVSGLLIAK